MRVLALDYGSARCGAAVSDPTGTLATPLEPVLRPATRKGFRARRRARARRRGAERVIVGLPLSLSGADSAQTAETRAFAERLRGAPCASPSSSTTSASPPGSPDRAGGSASLDSRAAAVLLDEWLTVFGDLPIEGP